MQSLYQQLLIAGQAARRAQDDAARYAKFRAAAWQRGAENRQSMRAGTGLTARILAILPDSEQAALCVSDIRSHTADIPQSINGCSAILRGLLKTGQVRRTGQSGQYHYYRNR